VGTLIEQGTELWCTITQDLLLFHGRAMSCTGWEAYTFEQEY
jgi:hypothetical protein